MSEETKNQELKYYERLNIQVLTIDKVKLLIKRNVRNTLTCWDKGKNIQRIAFHIIGPAGVGKTDICKQIATELTEETKRLEGLFRKLKRKSFGFQMGFYAEACQECK